MTTPHKVLRQHGLRPRKALGQCFLQDRGIAQKIVALADIRPGDLVVEIGAGTGILTALLAERQARVIALEIDPPLVTILEERLRDYPQVTVLLADVLAFDFADAAREARQPLKVIGNIPYHISSPILFHLLAGHAAIEAMTLMFQKEVADRLQAAPASKAYGIPTVMLAQFARVSAAFDVSPRCFYPVPKVTSSVLRIDILQSPRFPVVDAVFWASLVKAAFAQRRKTLLNSLQSDAALGTGAEVRSALETAGVEPSRRAETLSVEEFASVERALAGRG
jgi:16S rRNA (adenine1518-N6/adenine1519-N6)-dimethyltransferase